MNIDIEELLKQAKQVKKDLNIEEKSTTEVNNDLDFIQKTLDAVEHGNDLQNIHVVESFKRHMADAFFKDNPEMMAVFEQQTKKTTKELIDDIKKAELDLDPLLLVDQFFNQTAESKQVFESNGINLKAEDMKLVYETMKQKHKEDLNAGYE